MTVNGERTRTLDKGGSGGACNDVSHLHAPLSNRRVPDAQF